MTSAVPHAITARSFTPAVGCVRFASWFPPVTRAPSSAGAVLRIITAHRRAIATNSAAVVLSLIICSGFPAKCRQLKWCVTGPSLRPVMRLLERTVGPRCAGRQSYLGPGGVEDCVKMWCHLYERSFVLPLGGGMDVGFGTQILFRVVLSVEHLPHPPTSC